VVAVVVVVAVPVVSVVAVAVELLVGMQAPHRRGHSAWNDVMEQKESSPSQLSASGSPLHTVVVVALVVLVDVMVVEVVVTDVLVRVVTDVVVVVVVTVVVEVVSMQDPHSTGQMFEMDGFTQADLLIVPHVFRSYSPLHLPTSEHVSQR
jgi:hypothetical protein